MSLAKVLCLCMVMIAAVSAYRAQVPSGRGYPNIPGTPPFNPGPHHGLPQVYRHKFKRSADEAGVELDEQAYQEEYTQVLREPRSAQQPYIIFPTYRPVPQQPSRPILV